jgi:hypothetical protein
MELSRNRNKEQNSRVKELDSFIDKGADLPVTVKASADVKRELTKPVSVSLTDTDKNKLDGFARKLNYLLLDAGDFTPKSVGRSDLVKILINQLDQMSEGKLVEFYKTNNI